MKVHTLHQYLFSLQRLVGLLIIARYINIVCLAPSMPPQSLTVRVTSSISLTATWDAPLSESHNGIIRAYVVVVHSGIDQTFTTINRAFNMSGLKPYTTYSVKVAAVTVETGPFTVLHNVTTLEDG